jgi:hypothetical protein
MGTKAAGSLSASCSGARRLLLRGLAPMSYAKPEPYHGHLHLQPRAYVHTQDVRRELWFPLPDHVNINATQSGPFTMIQSMEKALATRFSVLYCQTHCGPAAAQPRPGKLQVPESTYVKTLSPGRRGRGLEYQTNNGHGVGTEEGVRRARLRSVSAHMGQVGSHLHRVHTSATRHNAHSPLASCSVSLPPRKDPGAFASLKQPFRSLAMRPSLPPEPTDYQFSSLLL